jgi:hypothetical protein
MSCQDLLKFDKCLIHRTIILYQHYFKNKKSNFFLKKTQWRSHPRWMAENPPRGWDLPMVGRGRDLPHNGSNRRVLLHTLRGIEVAGSYVFLTKHEHKD